MTNIDAKKKSNAKNAATKTATDKTQQIADDTQKDITATLNMTAAERMAKLNKQYGT